MAIRRAKASRFAGLVAAAGVGLTRPARRSATPQGAANSTAPSAAGLSLAATAVAVSGQCAMASRVPV